jgi:hypothetical protein
LIKSGRWVSKLNCQANVYNLVGYSDGIWRSQTASGQRLSALATLVSRLSAEGHWDLSLETLRRLTPLANVDGENRRQTDLLRVTPDGVVFVSRTGAERALECNEQQVKIEVDT